MEKGERPAFTGGPVPPGSPAWLDEVFSYHAPTADDVEAYSAIRAAARHFAEVIIAKTPRSADQTTALRHVRTAVMTANAAVALRGIA